MAGTAGADPATGPFDALGRLTAEKWDAGAITKGSVFLPGSNLAGSYSTSLTNAGINTNVYSVSSMTWQGPLLASYDVSSNWDGSGTAYAAAYDADAHLLQWNATPVSSAGAATQQFNEGYTFKLENLKTVNATNSIGASIVSNYNYADAVSAERVTSVTFPSALVNDSYVYDKRGRGLVVQHKLSATQSPAQDSYEYDSLNRLTSIAHLGAVQETLGYDGAGDLASRQFPSGSPDIARYYVGDDLTLVNHDASTTTGFVHIRLGGKRLASFWSKTASGVSTNGIIYYHRDRRGDVVATTANGGVMGLSYRYLPSGAVDKIVNASGTAVAPGSEPDNLASELGFIGGLKLSGGLIHLKARVYSPVLRRFLQPDTVDARRYTYASGDVLNLVDPSGRNPAQASAASEPTVYQDDGGTTHMDFPPVLITVGDLPAPPPLEAQTGAQPVTIQGDPSPAGPGGAMLMSGGTATLGGGSPIAGKSANSGGLASVIPSASTIRTIGAIAGVVALAGVVTYGALTVGTGVALAASIGGVLGFTGGFVGGLLNGQSMTESLKSGVMGAGMGAVAAVLPAAAVVSGILIGGGAGGVSDVLTQAAGNEPFNPYSTMFSVGAGMLIGGATALIPGTIGAGLDNQTFEQTVTSGPAALAIGVAYNAGVPTCRGFTNCH